MDIFIDDRSRSFHILVIYCFVGQTFLGRSATDTVVSNLMRREPHVFSEGTCLSKSANAPEKRRGWLSVIKASYEGVEEERHQ